MLDIKFVRENPEIVKQNIRNKFQDNKLELVDKVIELDKENREIKQEVEALRAERNKTSKQIGALMAQGKRDEAEEVKKQVAASGARIDELSAREKEVEEELLKNMMVIPNIIDPSVPIGKDDSENVEIEKFGEPVVPDFEVPYHTDIMESFDGIDLDSARRVAGNGFYYLMGDIARLHSAVIAYARDFMINRGFTYCVPPFMIRSNVVTGVMSFAEMDAMMYKIEGEDLYLIGTSEHSMIGKFIDQIVPEEELPKTLTSYSPCFRKEKGAHGLEERGVYRIHQFEKQEMIVVCKPEESPMWFDKLWQNTVDLFRSLDIPVRTLECCSGDLADLKVKSLDVEAWSPRQKKYFEVGSCSNLGDAQARRLRIRVNGKDGKKYLAHTLNNTVVAPPRMLIAFLENNLNADGSVSIPEALQPYMGGMKRIEKKTRAEGHGGVLLHSFLKAVGFSKVTKREEMKEIILDVIKNYDEKNVVEDHPDGVFAQFSRFYGNDCGITVCGQYDDDNRFHVEYYYPFFRGTGITTQEQVTVERHADKDAFSAACDDLRIGITLIFYLQNAAEYMKESKKQLTGNQPLTLSGLAGEGKILFPVLKDKEAVKVEQESSKNRSSMIAAARNGDEEAMENLTMEEMDTYSMISNRIVHEDILSIVDSYFMPYGIQCDQYSILGEIIEYHTVQNNITDEELVQMTVECNNIRFDICINRADLLGDPAVGRRFKGTIWLQGQLHF